jgi:hypothetical protein
MARLILMFSVAALSAFNCLANTYTFTGTSGGEAQNVKADVTLTGSTLTIVLSNLQNNMNDAGQEISGFYLNLGSAVTVTSYTETGTDRTVNSDGTYIDGGTDSDGSIPPGSTIDWGINGSTPTNQIFLNALVGAQPDLMIIGPAGAGNKYPLTTMGGTQVNPTLWSNFIPHLTPTGTTFTLHLSAPPTSLGGVIFEFGTGPDSNSGMVQPPSVPEPRWTALLLTLVVGLVGFVFRRFRSVDV